MSSFLNFLESIKLFLFLFGICAFDISTKSGIKIETRPIHIVLIVAVIFGSIFGIFTIGINKFENHRLFYNGLSGAVLFSIALTMAGSSFLLPLFSLGNRKSQILLLRKIGEFDRRMHENFTFHIESRKYRTNLIAHMFAFVLYEVLLFVTQVIFKYHADTHLLLFFTFYSASDVSFSAHTAYVISHGKYLINRYGVLNHHLKIILNAKRQPMRKKYSLLMSLYEKLFQLQLLAMECFGSILLFTIIFHMIAITVSVYVFINGISTDFERFSYYVMTYATWLLPYYVRICYIASTFATVTSQVRPITLVGNIKFRLE